jgi:hypothetical protein
MLPSARRGSAVEGGGRSHFYPNRARSSSPRPGAPQRLGAAAAARAGYARGMRVLLESDRLEVRLAPWEKVLGLLGNITVARSDIEGATVLDDGVAAAMRTGLKAGLRVPWVRYVARTVSLDEAFIVRRGVPALELSIGGSGRLRRVLVSTPDAEAIAAKLNHEGVVGARDP